MMPRIAVKGALAVDPAARDPHHTENTIAT